MKSIAFFVLLSVCLASHVFAQAGLQPAAVVNLIRSEPITVGQLRSEVERFERASGQALNGQERRMVLDTMINERLVLQAAERDRVTVTDNELNQHINQMRAQMSQMAGRQISDAEFATEIRGMTGLEMPAFREQTRRQAIKERYIFTQKQNLIEGSMRQPTEAEITARFGLMRADLVRPDTIRLSMIHVPYGVDAAARTRARQQIDNLAREIGQNAVRFEEVIARSRAPNSGFHGGTDLIPRNPEAVQRLGQDFVDTAFGLRPGQVSGVIGGRAGYWLVMVTEFHAMRVLELNDAILPGSPLTVRAAIVNNLMQERQAAAFTQAVQELLAELRAGGRTFQVFEANLNW